jgi:hypothetical protein
MGAGIDYNLTLYRLLCTGASLSAPYSLLLISNKFWMGRVGSRRGRSKGAESEGENNRGGGVGEWSGGAEHGD